MRSAKWFVWPGLAIVCLASLGYTLLQAGDSARSSARQRGDERRKLETNRDWVRTRVIDERGSRQSRSFDSPIIRKNPIPRSNVGTAQAGAPPPFSPGQNIGWTGWDAQAIESQGYQVARKTGVGLNRIHFTWTAFYTDIPGPIDPSESIVHYSGYGDPEDYPNMDDGFYNGSWTINGSARPKYSNIDVVSTNKAHVGMHVFEDYYPGICLYRPLDAWFVNGDDIPEVFALGGDDNTCPYSNCEDDGGGVLWPRIAADRGSSIAHEIAHSNVDVCSQHKLWYWRFNGTSWSPTPGFISETDDISYALAVDDIGQKLAIVTHASASGCANVFYLESTDNGTSWLPPNTSPDGPPPTPTQITNYTDPEGPQAWFHLTATYDNAGTLHAMWDEQERSGSGHIAIKHWNSTRNTIRTAALGYWDCPVSTGLFNLNLAKLSIGIGDGSTSCGGPTNLNYVYCTYTQFGGNTAAELADYSDETSVEGRDGGYMNGEIYLVVSNSGGNTWSPSVNLTNTKTPGCFPSDESCPPSCPPLDDCASEHWATINRVVNDLDILFIVDRDAGSIPYGEGSWQLNPVHYLKLSGSGLTTAEGVCPVIAPVFEVTLSSVPDCEYHASQLGQDEAILTLINLGNDDLSGVVSVNDFPGAPTLTVSDPGPYAIPSGTADLVKTVTMSANGAAEGIYSGEISITHNDPSEPSPRVIPIDFFVFNEFYCPGSTCTCPCLYDPECDGVIVDVLDVVTTANVAFRALSATIDPLCPKERTDVDADADGVTSITDVVKVINVAFRNQSIAANFVDPCL